MNACPWIKWLKRLYAIMVNRYSILRQTRMKERQNASSITAGILIFNKSPRKSNNLFIRDLIEYLFVFSSSSSTLSSV